MVCLLIQDYCCDRNVGNGTFLLSTKIRDSSQTTKNVSVRAPSRFHPKAAEKYEPVSAHEMTYEPDISAAAQRRCRQSANQVETLAPTPHYFPLSAKTLSIVATNNMSQTSLGSGLGILERVVHWQGASWARNDIYDYSWSSYK